jgi:hypothetical protein
MASFARIFDLHQTGGCRAMGLRWTFDGPDRYHETLLEAAGPDGLKPLAEWDHIRSTTPAAPRPDQGEQAARPSEGTKVLEPLLDHTWEARGEAGGEWASAGAVHLQTTFEWIPYADAIYARTLAMTGDGEPMHLLDAYFYHHTGTGALHCLALSSRGGVYEGALTEHEDGALHLDLRGYERDEVVPHVVRFDVEQHGALRQRVWCTRGAERTLMRDVRHRKLEPRDEAWRFRSAPARKPAVAVPE